MNLVPARMSADGGAVECAGASALRLPAAVPARGGRDVTLGIRPEHFRPVGERDASVILRVDHAEILGADTLVYGRFGEERTSLTVRLSGVHHVSRKTNVHLAVDPRNLHLFELGDGTRIECDEP